MPKEVHNETNVPKPEASQPPVVASAPQVLQPSPDSAGKPHTKPRRKDLIYSGPVYLYSTSDQTFRTNSSIHVSSKVADAKRPFLAAATTLHPKIAGYTFNLVVNWHETDTRNITSEKSALGREMLNSKMLRVYNRARAKEVVNKLDENGVEYARGLELYCFLREECVDFEGALVLMDVRNAC
jgi:hypothetical protein